MAKSLKKPNELEFTEEQPAAAGTTPPIKEEESYLTDKKSEGASDLEVIKIKQKQEILEGLRQDREERKKFAGWVFWLIVGWLISDLIVVLLVGKECLKLSDPVLITLITTTTGSVIAIFLYVMVYLFKGTLPYKNSKSVKTSTKKKK